MVDLFSGTRSADYFQVRMNSIKHDIYSLSENEILNIGVEQYSDYFQNAYEEEFPIIEVEKITISSYVAEIVFHFYKLTAKDGKFRSQYLLKNRKISLQNTH